MKKISEEMQDLSLHQMYERVVNKKPILRPFYEVLICKVVEGADPRHVTAGIAWDYFKEFGNEK